MDLQLAMTTAQLMYLEALEDGTYEEKALSNVRKFMNQIASLVMMKEQKPETAPVNMQTPTMAAPPVAPPGAPGPMMPGMVPPVLQ
jgi:hypothetical protein